MECLGKYVDGCLHSCMNSLGLRWLWIMILHPWSTDLECGVLRDTAYNAYWIVWCSVVRLVDL